MKNRLLIKVCGMRDAENIRAVEDLGIDYMGFIFYEPSPRNVSLIPDYLPKKSKRVGVFVNASIECVTNKIQQFQFDAIQLHGNESPQFCDNVSQLGVDVIKAFSISDISDLQNCNKYDGHCSLYVFDTKTSKFGGSGKQFDWTFLQEYSGKTPFLLSGGIDEKSIDAILQINHSQLVGVDLNSRFEIAPAKKNVELLQQFIIELREKSMNYGK